MKDYYDIVVIGSNIDAIVSASLIAKMERSVLLLKLSPSFFQDNDLIFEYSPTPPFVLSLKNQFVSVLKDLDISPSTLKQLHTPDPPIQIAFKNLRLNLFSRRDRVIETLQKLIKTGDIENIKDFYGMLDKLEDMYVEPSLKDELLNNNSRIKALRHKIKISSAFDRFGTGSILLDKFKFDPLFRLIMSIQIKIYSHVDLENPSLLNMAILLSGRQEGSYYLTSNTTRIIAPMEDVLIKNGGDIINGPGIDEFIIERGRIKGVLLSDQEGEISCETVILCTSMRHLTELLPPDISTKKYLRRIKNLTIKYIEAPLFYTIPKKFLPVGLSNYLVYLNDPELPWEGENFFKLSIMEDHKQRRDSDLVGMSVNVLIPFEDPDKIENLYQDITKKVMERLNDLFPFTDGKILSVGVNECIQYCKEYHLNNNLKYITKFEPWWNLYSMPINTPIKNLFLSGREVLPSLGLEGEIISGRIAANKALRAIGYY